jgi:hypothetical protein
VDDDDDTVKSNLCDEDDVDDDIDIDDINNLL